MKISNLLSDLASQLTGGGGAAADPVSVPAAKDDKDEKKNSTGFGQAYQIDLSPEAQALTKALEVARGGLAAVMGGAKSGDDQTDQLDQILDQVFDVADLNKDGVVTVEELEKMGASKEKAQQFIEGIDTDDDGAISRAEFHQRAKPAGDPLSAFNSPGANSVDENGDGRVSAEELKKILDSNGDGKVSDSELAAALQQVADAADSLPADDTSESQSLTGGRNFVV